MKVALVTNFPSRFVNEKIVPDLEARGLHVITIETPTRAARMNLASLDIEQVLFMNELTSHSESDALSDACKDNKIPIRALSRKKASWPWQLPIDGPITLITKADDPMRSDLSVATMITGEEHRKSQEKKADAVLLKEARKQIVEIEQLSQELLTENEVLRKQLVEAENRANLEAHGFDEKCKSYEKALAEERAKPPVPSNTDKIVNALRMLTAEGVLTRDEAASKLVKTLMPE